MDNQKDTEKENLIDKMMPLIRSCYRKVGKPKVKNMSNINDVYLRATLSHWSPDNLEKLYSRLLESNKAISKLRITGVNPIFKGYIYKDTEDIQPLLIGIENPREDKVVFRCNSICNGNIMLDSSLWHRPDKRYIIDVNGLNFDIQEERYALGDISNYIGMSLKLDKDKIIRSKALVVCSLDDILKLHQVENKVYKKYTREVYNSTDEYEVTKVGMFLIILNHNLTYLKGRLYFRNTTLTTDEINTVHAIDELNHSTGAVMRFKHLPINSESGEETIENLYNMIEIIRDILGIDQSNFNESNPHYKELIHQLAVYSDHSACKIYETTYEDKTWKLQYNYETEKLAFK
jgi:hypothetical protein